MRLKTQYHCPPPRNSPTHPLASLLASPLLPALALALTLSPTPATPQVQQTDNTWKRTEDAPAAPGTADDMAWLAGHWTGEALGGTVDEIWSPPRDGAMMGMFRLVKDGKTVFYELMTILEEDGGLVLRLKHFNGGSLEAWEEKKETVDFPLVEIAGDTYRFEGLTFHRKGDDLVDVHLAMHGKGGTIQEVTFTYARVPPGGGAPTTR